MDITPATRLISTPLGFLDGRRPLVMPDADRIFDRLFLDELKGMPELIGLSSRFASVIRSVNTYAVDEAWTYFEGEFNKGREVRVQATTDFNKYMTMFSMLYTAINRADPMAQDTRQFAQLRDNYYAARDYINAKFSATATGRDKRTLENIIYTTDQRIIAISRHYNERIAEGTMAGPELSTSTS
ncbi:MAG: hypothetical protein KDK78_00350 [Chlamydiia bacterium]|nr:hypothetical protein [Chlamydiia bacterium]